MPHKNPAEWILMHRRRLLVGEPVAARTTVEKHTRGAHVSRPPPPWMPHVPSRRMRRRALVSDTSTASVRDLDSRGLPAIPCGDGHNASPPWERCVCIDDGGLLAHSVAQQTQA